MRLKKDLPHLLAYLLKYLQTQAYTLTHHPEYMYTWRERKKASFPNPPTPKKKLKIAFSVVIYI